MNKWKERMSEWISEQMNEWSYKNQSDVNIRLNFMKRLFSIVR